MDYLVYKIFVMLIGEDTCSTSTNKSYSQGYLIVHRIFVILKFLYDWVEPILYRILLILLEVSVRHKQMQKGPGSRKGAI